MQPAHHAQWLAWRHGLVGLSMARRRVLRPTPPQPPTLLAHRYALAFDQITRRRVSAFARDYLDLSRRHDALSPLVRTGAELIAHYAMLFGGDFHRVLAVMVGDVAKFNLAEISQLWVRVLGLPYTDHPSIAGQLVDARQRNADLVTRMAREAMDRVRDTVEDLQGEHVETIARALMEDVDVSASRARLIARDQTLKLNGNLTQARHEAAGITRYEWVTSQDERVRPGHVELNGREFDWQHPPVVDPRSGRRAHPGGDYQCRCVANPVIDLDAIH